MNTKQPDVAIEAPRDAQRSEPVVHLRHPGRWLATLVVGVLLAMAAHTLLTNPRFQWSTVGDYLTASTILTGLGRTLELMVLAMGIAIVLGTVLAIMRLSGARIVSTVSAGYVWLFRGIPLLVLIIFFFNISALYPELSLGIPFGPEFVRGNANAFVTPFVAAVGALAIHESAYMAEIVRAGIASVPRGQVEAAQALGIRPGQAMRRIILPQAMRFIVPPTTNQIISMTKNTSLVSVIALPELLYSAQIIYSKEFNTIPLLIVATIWYLVVVSALTVVQYFVERHFNESIASGGSGGGVLRRVLHNLTHLGPDSIRSGMEPRT